VLKTKSKRLYRYSQKRYRFKPTGQLVLQFPAKSASVIVAQQRKDSTFFKADLQLPLRYARKKAPRCLTVCWDVSLSRSQSQLQKEKQLLKRYLHYMHEGRVELLVFAHKVLLRNFVTVKNGRAPALFACLDQQDYDGATALSQLPFQTMRGDEILVFTDGMQSMGSVPINACVTPIHVIQSSLRADEGPLRAIAKASHGTFCSLTQQSLDQAFFMLCTQSLQFLGFSTQKQLKNTTILEGSGAFGVLNVTGVLSGKPSHLTANYGLGKRIIHSERLSITYQTNPQNEGAIYEKVWALSRVQELEQEPKRNKDTLLQLGLKYKLPTDQTSLLVLDAVEDYVAHEIVPPKSMQKKYWHLVHLKHRADKKALADHWENLKKDWKDYRFWYAHPNYKRNRSKNELPNINQALPQESRAQASPSSVQETETTITESNFMISTDSIQVSAANSYSWTPTFSGATSGTYTYRISSMPFTAATNVTNGCATVNPDAASLPQAHLKIAAWNPKMPYLIALKKVPLKKAYACYLNLRKNYQDQPSFYIDVCDYFLRYHENESAMRILSNLAEMQLQDASLLRILAQKLMQVKASQLAMPLFKELIDMRPDEPQSYRDYGLALASIGQYQEAIEQLYKVVEKPFDPRFTGIDLIALNEINHLYFTHQKELNVAFIEPVFLQKMQYDIRVVLSWDANDTDVDLWVNEPYGEKCMYSYKNTKNGGRISNDFTQGYGPEEYLIKQAPKGEYRIQAHYYGDHRASLNGKAQLTIQFYLHYGTPFEVKKEVTRRLQVVDQEIDLATFEF
jgi:tetratricopeptide (TPR) repeat protein